MWASCVRGKTFTICTRRDADAALFSCSLRDADGALSRGFDVAARTWRSLIHKVDNESLISFLVFVHSRTLSTANQFFATTCWSCWHPEQSLLSIISQVDACSYLCVPSNPPGAQAAQFLLPNPPDSSQAPQFSCLSNPCPVSQIFSQIVTRRMIMDNCEEISIAVLLLLWWNYC